MRHMVFRNQVKPDVPVPRGDLAKLFPAQVQTSCNVIASSRASWPAH